MTQRRLYISTGNKGKIKEIRGILKGLPFQVLSKDDVNLKGLTIEEDGKTLEENAINKAVSLAKEVKGMVIADDTGLFVECLDGQPGIHSARYSGENATDKSNNTKLLDRLKGIPMDKRQAFFKTVIALILEDGKIITVTGQCHGYIGFEPKGEGGFGYDPLFLVEGYNKSFAELGDEIKNKISHRAIALEKLRSELMRI